jgi:hypothetical protein
MAGYGNAIRNCVSAVLLLYQVIQYLEDNCLLGKAMISE